MARQEGQGQAPGSPRMYRVERGKGDRERSQRSWEGGQCTLVKKTRQRQPTNTVSMLLWPKDCIWQLDTSPFNLARAVSGR